MLRTAAYLGIVAGIACCAYAGYSYRQPDEPAVDYSGVEVVYDPAENGPLTVGVSRITLTVRNPTSRSIRVVGNLENCTVRACLKSPEPLDLPIPPGGERRIPLDIAIRSAGDFEVPFEIYIDAGHLLVRSTVVTGTALAK